MTSKKATLQRCGRGWRLVLPVAPVPCPRPRFARNGRAYMPATYKKWSQEFQRVLGELDPPPPDADPWTVTMVLSCKRPKSPANPFPVGDVDNYAKSILDNIQGRAFFFDDKQVTTLHVCKVYTTCAPCIVVEFHPNEDEE